MGKIGILLIVIGLISGIFAKIVVGLLFFIFGVILVFSAKSSMISCWLTEE